MPKTYYDSELTAAEIESVLKAIHNVISPSNNGKILAIESGRFVAKSASEYSGEAVLEPLNVSANGDYYPRSGTDGFSEAHITVPSYPEPTGTINISANGLVNVKDYAEANVQVPGGGSNIEVIPLSVTANGTYTAPAGKAYSPVTVNVSGEGSVENASLFRWAYGSLTTCWGIMKKLTGDVIGQNGDNANPNITLIGDLMTVTFHGTSQAVEVLATTAITLKAYRTGRTLGPATMTEYTMAVNDQQNFTTDYVYGGLYLEAESAQGN